MAGMAISGICGSGIIEVVGEMVLAGIVDSEGVVDSALAAKSPRIIANGRTYSYLLHDGAVPILITQNDIRAIQLAKAALYAGIRLLMDHMEIDTVDSISLAGAFGSHIDPRYAMLLGMIPDCDPERVKSVGNAAGSGARIVLLDRKSRGEIENVLRRVEKVETATEAGFQQHFVDAMAIPHRTASYERLGAVMALPKKSSSKRRISRRR